MSDKRKAYEEKFDAQLEEAKAQIALLKARANKATAEARIEYYKTIESLQHGQEKAMAKLQELKNTGDETWEDLRTGAEHAWDEVKSAIHSTAAKLK